MSENPIRIRGEASAPGVPDSAAVGPTQQLQAFVAEAPVERPLILAFVSAAAARTSQGSRVLDAGAGNAPYRELFAHCQYRTTDWAKSPHPGAREADIIAPLDALPVDDESFDTIVCTQVLEHVPDPATVLGELHRVLAKGGHLWLSVPFVGELHEEPHDYWRYTPYALRMLLERAGFVDASVEPLGGYFTAVGVLAWNGGTSIGVRADSRDLPRRVVAASLRAAARALPALDRLDRRRALPVGWACTARRPGD
jgi:SAM-dependent methyltransferase